jgi:hypothetical protein
LATSRKAGTGPRSRKIASPCTVEALADIEDNSPSAVKRIRTRESHGGALKLTCYLLEESVWSCSADFLPEIIEVLKRIHFRDRLTF